ncbi:MAG: D-tyrosyl-tRNA(Tyr) deacylase [Lachnospiraceae bacterium]|jgi:D-tyrosyl-tRNA(Tyr) deacylase|nr:D-tyrosyl-tRNA(Tyr) deacylase [Lachnospiraceae bacterium]
MRFVIQRVSQARVTVEEETVGQIGRGFLVLAGIGAGDDRATADKMIRKLLGLRIFPDAEGKINLDLKAVGGGLLIISQFTLYADCKKGNRPSFTKAGTPEMAEALYEYIVSECAKEIAVVETGVFAASMKVALVNEGPFTVILDSEEL